MEPVKRQIIIPKEQAVFWMDKNGFWHNEHGKMEHPKIIAFFNSAIRKDDLGYHVFQDTDEFTEKVYFSYEDTALFVVDLSLGPPAVLALNTRTHISLDPSQLFSRDDALYLDTGEHRIKFTDRALMKLSRIMEDRDTGLVLVLDGTDHPIPSR
ncbi:MAG: MFS transporter permease [Pseudomonadota bacterium]